MVLRCGKVYAKAEPLLKEALDFFQKTLGSEDRRTVVSLNNLGLIYQDMGDFVKAEPMLEEALEIFQHVPAKG